MSQSHDDQLAIVLGQRQLIAVCCMFLVVMGLVSTLAYVAGRSISVAQAKMQERPEQPVPAIVVESVRPDTVPGPMQAQAQTIPPVVSPVHTVTVQQVQKPPQKVVVPPVTEPSKTMESAAVMGEPMRGQTFWQVGIVDRGIAAMFVEHLSRRGFQVRTAPAGPGNLQKVLVGPLADGEMDKVKKGLDAAGLPSFLKRY